MAVRQSFADLSKFTTQSAVKLKLLHYSTHIHC